VTSNDICRLDKDYNPLKHIVGYIRPYGFPYDTKDHCCGFVADNIAWFKIWIEDLQGWTNEFKVPKMRLNNLSFIIDTYSPSSKLVYDNGWTGDLLTGILFPTTCPVNFTGLDSCGGGINYRVVTCENLDAATTTFNGQTIPCKQNGYPLLWVHVWLNAVSLNLAHVELPSLLKIHAGVQVDYAWQSEAQLQEQASFTLQMDTFMSVGKDINAPVATTAVAASSNVAFIATGAGVAAVAIAAVIGAVVFYSRKNKASAPQKLEETTA
jgi:hypothetical protein